MKEKLTKNIGLKILAVILAALLWLIITNVEDPMTTGRIRNMTVEILNENAIKSLNQVYQITEGKTIDFTFKARRKIADNLTDADFKVTADLSKLTDMNNVTINIDCPAYGDEVTIIDASTHVLKVQREQLISKQFKVNVKQKGVPAEGYYVAQKTTNTILTVSGPKSKIDSIAEIVSEVDVTDEAGSFRIYEEPKALDGDGNEINPDNIKYSQSYVPINITMYRTKVIDLLITVSGTPADGYIMTAADYQPKTIEVAGTDSDLSGLQDLEIDENIDGASQTIEKEINLQEHLNQGIILVGDNQTVALNITIEPAETKELTFQTGDIEVRNKPADLELAFLTSGPISIELMGPVTDMADISERTVKPYIDLTNYSGGTYHVDVLVDVNGFVTLTNEPTVTLNLK